ncbi:MAG: hypothetical protein WC536_02600 [Patescibacteria group bacterium]
MEQPYWSKKQSETPFHEALEVSFSPSLIIVLSHMAAKYDQYRRRAVYSPVSKATDS